MSWAPRVWAMWAVVALVMALLSVGMARARSEMADGSTDTAVLWGN